jgi:hypothetical protein
VVASQAKMGDGTCAREGAGEGCEVEVWGCVPVEGETEVGGYVVGAMEVEGS